VRFDRIPGHDPQGPYWQGYRWSQWYLFDDIGRGHSSDVIEEADDDKGFTTHAALYRFRVWRRMGLLYIGQTGRSAAARLHNHYRGMLIAAGELSANARRILRFHQELDDYRAGGLDVEASWTSVKGLDKGDRLGIEAELIAAYRAVMGTNPSCQFLDRGEE
jgi:hypothetical protein